MELSKEYESYLAYDKASEVWSTIEDASNAVVDLDYALSRQLSDLAKRASNVCQKIEDGEGGQPVWDDLLNIADQYDALAQKIDDVQLIEVATVSQQNLDAVKAWAGDDTQPDTMLDAAVKQALNRQAVNGTIGHALPREFNIPVGIYRADVMLDDKEDRVLPDQYVLLITRAMASKFFAGAESDMLSTLLMDVLSTATGIKFVPSIANMVSYQNSYAVWFDVDKIADHKSWDLVI